MGDICVINTLSDAFHIKHCCIIYIADIKVLISAALICIYLLCRNMFVPKQ